jgi:hypothetical protein
MKFIDTAAKLSTVLALPFVVAACGNTEAHDQVAAMFKDSTPCCDNVDLTVVTNSGPEKYTAHFLKSGDFTLEKN